jgi:hypothetical protein
MYIAYTTEGLSRNPRVELAALFLCAATGVFAQDLAPAIEALAAANAPQPPAALDGKGRIQEYLKSLVRPSAVFSNVLIAGFEEARNFPHEWHRTGAGFEKRLASQYAQYFLDNTIELGFSTIHHEDNRYSRVGDGNFFKRFGSVVKSAVVVSNARGGQTIALGQIAGAFGSWAIASQVWEPPSEQRLSRVLLWGSVNLAAKGGRNLIREFGPELRKKHALPTTSHP